MKKMRYFNAWVPGTHLRKGNLHAFQLFISAFLIVLFSCLAGPTRLNAQVDWVQQDSFKIGYQLNGATDSLLANQQYAVDIHLKTLLNLKCQGGTFSFKFPDHVMPDSTNPYHIPGNSWLGTASELIAKSETGIADNSVKWTFSRYDGDLRSGSGIILTLNLIVGSEAISVEEMMKALKEGLILIDNIDMLKFRGDPGPSTSSIGVYPNPFRNEVNFGLFKPEKLRVRVFDMQFQILFEGIPDSNGQMKLGELPSGIYLFEVKRGEKMQAEFFKLIKQ